MDLSNLSNNLPPTRPITDESINAINHELSNEFKVGARSIAALYRLSNLKNDLLKSKGYLNCLTDLIQLIETNEFESIDEFKQVLVNKKNELTNTDQTETVQNTQTPSSNRSATQKHAIEADGQIITPSKPSPTTDNNGKPYEFSMSSPSPFHFPSSKIPMSIQHNSNIKHYQQSSSSLKKTSTNLTKSKTIITNNISTYTNNNNNNDDDEFIYSNYKQSNNDNKDELVQAGSEDQNDDGNVYVITDDSNKRVHFGSGVVSKRPRI